LKTLTYQFDIGNYQGFILNDYSGTHTADELIANPSIEELEQLTQEFSFELEKIPVDYNNLLFKTGNQLVLVDTGIPRPSGNLFSGLEEIRIDPGAIDTIVITHSDMDHIGGILDTEGKISFPNARYIVMEDIWQYWTSEESRTELAGLNKWAKEKVEFAWETYSKIRDLIHLVKSEEEFIPGFRMFAAPGHRYDHSILKVTSSDEEFMHISDALAHPLFMAKRDWYSTYDANPAQAIETKEKLLRMCASENALVFGAHFPFPGLGYVQQKPGNWKWMPVEMV
jgi:glyoxylase-like metal-dependent hydrolase (beta-lactamase superfamily II)